MSRWARVVAILDHAMWGNPRVALFTVRWVLFMLTIGALGTISYLTSL